MNDITNKYQTFWKRFWAYFIDVFIFNIVMYVLLHLVRDNNLLDATTFIVVIGAAWISYRVIMHNCYGQTIGKRVTNVVVVTNIKESRLTVIESLRRELMSLVLTFLIVYAIIIIMRLLIDRSYFLFPQPYYDRETDVMLLKIVLGIFAAMVLSVAISSLIDKKRRALHDKIGNAVVIRSEFWEEKADQ